MDSADILHYWLDQYDIVAQRYGYTLYQFLKLTQKQLQLIILTALKGSYNDFLQAARTPHLDLKKLQPYRDPLEDSLERRKAKRSAIEESLAVVKAGKDG